MSETTKHVSTRREFLGHTGRIAAATTLAGLAVPRVHAAENNMLQVALIGCGGRGTGAAADALSVKQGPTKLVAAADVFENRVRSSVEGLKKRFADQVDVPQDRQFVGFDGYQKAMDCLKPGDIAIFASPLAFRWVHFGCAIQKGLHVFMEKPVTADGPTSRRMIKQAEEAKAKNLSRKRELRDVKWCKLTAWEILEEGDWNGQYIPLVPVIGTELQPFNGERMWEGMVRKARKSGPSALLASTKRRLDMFAVRRGVIQTSFVTPARIGPKCRSVLPGIIDKPATLLNTGCQHFPGVVVTVWLSLLPVHIVKRETRNIS